MAENAKDREWQNHKWVERKRNKNGKWIYNYGDGWQANGDEWTFDSPGLHMSAPRKRIKRQDPHAEGARRGQRRNAVNPNAKEPSPALTGIQGAIEAGRTFIENLLKSIVTFLHSL